MEAMKMKVETKKAIGGGAIRDYSINGDRVSILVKGKRASLFALGNGVFCTYPKALLMEAVGDLAKKGKVKTLSYRTSDSEDTLWRAGIPKNTEVALGTWKEKLVLSEGPMPSSLAHA